VITEALYTRIRELVVVEPLGPVLVKGKELPINIFALKELAVMPAAGCTS
jgi:class 3 adenylate cyclase